MTQLSPGQQQVYNGLESGLAVGNVLICWGKAGMGKTTILQEFHAAHGGAFLTVHDFMQAMRSQNPAAMEEAFAQLVEDALTQNEIVIIDDLHLLYKVMCDCGFTTYPRKGLIDAPLTTLAMLAANTGKKLIVGSNNSGPGPLQMRGYAWGVSKLGANDYAFFGTAFMGAEDAACIDFAKVHRFAPNLNGHQLKNACHWIKHRRQLTTDAFIEYLRTQNMTSNVQLSEVQDVNLHDLKGMDDVIESLEANIILPLENDALATQMSIRPKRGVLLVGPPGTGKTTVGRALAHRLKGKFFLLDGTVIAGTRQFYEQVQQIFEAAKQNAPAIIFVDDSDVIFESGGEMGLYRYLLTMLDGLESKTAGDICVMLTAMDVSSLPPALVRSGRIELWLETRLPDFAARQSLLDTHLAPMQTLFDTIDTAPLAEATEGMTGADLKRLVEDGKILYAYDMSRSREMLEPTAYFLKAVETVRANKERYAQAQAAARKQPAAQFPWEAMMGNMMTEDG